MTTTQPNPLLSPVYSIRVTNNYGSAVFETPLALSLSRRINEVSGYAFTLNGSDPRIDTFFSVDAYVEIYRAIPGLSVAPYREFVGFHRSPLKVTTSQGIRSFVSRGVGVNDLLQRRVVAYPKGSAGAQKSGPVDTVMAHYVAENAGPSALTSRGRYRKGVIPGLQVEYLADPNAAGVSNYPYWDGDRSLDNLLDVVQDLAEFGGLRFGVYSPSYGVYHFYPSLAATGVVGVNRTASNTDPDTGRNPWGNVPVVFSVESGTVQEIEYEIDRSGEKNVVFASSGGDFPLTTYVESIRKLDSPFNDREGGSMGGSEEGATVETLRSKAFEELRKNQAKRRMTFKPIQTARSLYGKNFAMGDDVTSVYDEDRLDQTVMGVDLSWVENGIEELSLEVENKNVA